MSHVMDSPVFYRLWQAPFAEQKLQPLLRRLGQHPPRKVLDVGCGPGTNAGHFLQCDYLGIDINPSYIDSATRRYGPRFRVADVTRGSIGEESGYDCILLNSLLHHLSDSEVDRVLASLPGLLAPGGTVHILDLIMPDRVSVSRMLARLDRGHYPRPLDRWKDLLTQHLSLLSFEPYSIRAAGIVLWRMLYFTGGRS